MKAIIETGGKQYYIEEGSIIYVEKLDHNPDEEVIFDRILMVNGVSGRPYVKNVRIIGKVLKHGKQKKLIIFKYRPKKSSHSKQGHRQPYTKVKIERIETIQ
ncbi:MAG: 50S ribosomal protein L21 [Bacilli bacterium]|jgi:large subunit ribosomal protein L21|nr:50S ribosomal protein L21 [Bacilli bacterium]